MEINHHELYHVIVSIECCFCLLPIKEPQHYRGYEVGAKNADPDLGLQHLQEFEGGGGRLDLLHEDDDADQVIEGDGEVNNILPLCHHTDSSYPHVSMPQ